VPAVSPRKARRLPDDLPRRGRGGTGRGGAGRGSRAVPGRGAGGGGGAGAEPGVDAANPSLPLGPERHEPWPDGDWVVRLIPGAASVKGYRCPGCDQEILPGAPHLVAWPAL